MMINGHNKEQGIKETRPEKTKNNLHLRRTSLASVESLTMPLVQEVVFLADFQCAWCQKRVGDIIDKMNGEIESVMMSVLEKKVTLTFTKTNYDLNIVKNPPLHHKVSVHLKPLSRFSLIKRLFGYANN